MLLLLFALGLILVNGFFVAAEFALVKVRVTQLDILIEQRVPNARTARHIVTHIDAYLAATQVGITLASLGLGYVAEPALSAFLAPSFNSLGVLDASSAAFLAAMLGFLLISFVHIVVGEAAPKSIAIAKPDSTALFVAAPLRIIYYLFFPFLWLLNTASNGLLRLIGVAAAPAGGHGMSVTPEELYHITAQSAAEGSIPTRQSELLTNVLTFSDRVAREIMVPRNRVVFIDATSTLEQALAIMVQSGHTRFPLTEGNLDNVLGVLHLKDLLPLILEKRTARLIELLRKVIYVPENMPAQKLMFEFQRQRSHLAIVVDEYGGLSGIVTMEDAIEELVGEIQDEFDVEAQPILKLDNGYSIDGGVLLSDVTALLHVPEVESDADTVGGYVMEKLNRIPEVGDTVELEGWELAVRAMDRLRIGRLDATQLATPLKTED